MIQRKFLRWACLAASVISFSIFLILERFFVIHYGNFDALPSKLRKRLKSGKLFMNDWISPSVVSHENLLGFPRILCGCKDSKTKELEKIARNKSRSHSSCSEEADVEGHGQKVVSYSLYLESEESLDFFLEGISPNLQLIAEFYPNWLTYIYTNIPVNKHSCNLICNNNNLFWCPIQSTPQHGDLSTMNGRLWRFLPIGDFNVDTFVSRDLDSLASKREKVAVDEWIKSSMTFHVMRDSQWHDTEILAGLWGVKNHLLPSNVKVSLQKKFILKGKLDTQKSLDQELLKENIFYPFKSKILAHDSYFCGQYDEAITLPFSIKRIEEEFVGHDHFKEINKLFVGRMQECPEQCRPSYGKDWKFC